MRRGRGGAAPAIGGAVWALMFSAALAGGVVLLLYQVVAAGWFCLGLAGIALLLLSRRR